MVRELSLKPSVLSANQSPLQCQNFAGRRLPGRERGCGEHHSLGMLAVVSLMSSLLPAAPAI